MPCIIPSYTHIRTFDDFEVHSFFHPPKGNIGNITNERIDCKLALFFFSAHENITCTRAVAVAAHDDGGEWSHDMHPNSHKGKLYCVYCTLHTQFCRVMKS